MTRILPYTNVTPLDGGINSRARSAEGVCCLVGISSAGTKNTVYEFDATQLDLVRATLGYGPLVEAIAQHFAGGAASCLAVRVDPDKVEADEDPAFTESVTAPKQKPTLTGIAHRGGFLMVEILADSGDDGHTKFRYSRDLGFSWSRAIRTDAPEADRTDAELGLVIAFPVAADPNEAGSYDKGDMFTVGIADPRIADTTLAKDAIAAAMRAALESNKSFEGFHVVNRLLDDEIDDALNGDDGLKKLIETEALTHKRFLWATCDLWSMEDGAAARVSALEAGVEEVSPAEESTRVGFTHAPAFFVSPFSGDALNVCAGAIIAGRRVSQPCATPTLRVASGPLPGLYLTADVPVPIETYTRAQLQALTGLRLTTVREHPGLTGVYVSDDLLMAASDSDYQTMERRRVMDKACRLLYAQTLQMLGSNVDTTNLETTLRALEEQLAAPLNQRLVANREAAAVRVVIPRNQDILTSEKLTYKIYVTPLAALRAIEGEVAFENPFAATAAA